MTLRTSFLPWHETAAASLQQSARSGALPHAWLVHAAPGTGARVFAEALADSLLCERHRGRAPACGACEGCALTAAGSHPDLVRVRPPVVARAEAAESAEAEGSDDDGDADASPTPDAEGGGKRAGRTIAVEAARRAVQFIGLAPLRGGLRVVLVYPAEALRAEGANTLLKALEEPTPGTHFVLVADSPDALPPTVVSRCRRLALPAPDRETALDWLRTAGAQAGDADLDDRLAAVGGAPFAVLEIAPAEWDVHDAFVTALERPDRLDPVALARTLDGEIRRADKARQSGERATMDLAAVVVWMQRFTADVTSLLTVGTVRYYPRRRPALEALAMSTAADPSRWIGFARFLARARREARQPVGAASFLEDCLLRYLEIVEARTRTPESAWR